MLLSLLLQLRNILLSSPEIGGLRKSWGQWHHSDAGHHAKCVGTQLTSREGRDTLGEAGGEGDEGHWEHSPGEIPEQVTVPDFPI